MKRGIYKGDIAHLKGEPALLRESDCQGAVLAQFDSFDATRDGIVLASGWHQFSESDFEMPDDGIVGEQWA